MRYIVFLAPNWNYTDGGINSFNFGLALAMGDTCRDKGYKVVCISLLDPPDSMVSKAAEHDVKVLSLRNEDVHIRYERDLPKISALITAWDDADMIYFVGHDTLTGSLANYLSTIQTIPAVPLVFHHMNYEAYYGIKGDPPADIAKKVNDQREVFAASENIVAVGPKLLGSAENKLSSLKRSYELIPGIEDITAKAAPEELAAIAFGRYDPENDRLKQIGLAARAFAKFVDTGYPAGADHRLLVIGTSEGHGAVELITQAKAGTDRFINIITEDYISDRTTLYDKISSAGAALMLSYHEGFGLVGLEAIAAGVPLILTVNSGLYKFLERELAGSELMDWGLIPVTVQVNDDGKPSPETLELVTQAYETFWNNRQALKKGVLALRERLRASFTWSHCAGNFLDILKDIASNQEQIQDKTAFQEKYDEAAANSTSSPQPLIQMVYGESTAPLVFRSRYTPLIGREKEWKTLQDFCQSPGKLAWHVLAGNAGTGKSRLALEFCITMAPMNWFAGFLSAGELERFDWSRWRPVWDTILVVDHIASKNNKVAAMLEDLQAISSSWAHKVRILLLERDPEGAWHEPLQSDAEEGKIPAEFGGKATLLTGLDNRELLRLISAMGIGRTGEDQVSMLKALRELDPSATPLFMILSLLSQADQPAGGGGRTALLKRYLGKESEEIARTILPDPEAQQQHKALVVLLTLIKGMTYDEFQQLLSARHSFLPQQPNEQVLSRWGLMNRDHQSIRGLEPDLLGEYFVLSELNNSSPMVPSLRPVAAAIIELAWSLAPEQVAAFILRAAADFPGKDLLTILPAPNDDFPVNYIANWLSLVPEVIKQLTVVQEGVTTAEALNETLQTMSLTAFTDELALAKAFASMELLQGQVKHNTEFDPKATFDLLISQVEISGIQDVSTEAAFVGFRLTKHFRKHWQFDAYWNSMKFLHGLQQFDPSHLASHLLKKINYEHPYWALQEERAAKIPETMALPMKDLLSAGAASAEPHSIIMHAAVFTALRRGDFTTALSAYEHLKKFAAMAADPLITQHQVNAITNLMSSGRDHWKELSVVLDDYHDFAMVGSAKIKADYLHFWAEGIDSYSMACPEELNKRESQIDQVAASLPGDTDVEAAHGELWEAKLKFLLRQMDEANALKVYGEIIQRFPPNSDANIDLRWQMALELGRHYRLLGEDQQAKQYIDEARDLAARHDREHAFEFHSALDDFK